MAYITLFVALCVWFVNALCGGSLLWGAIETPWQRVSVVGVYVLFSLWCLRPTVKYVEVAAQAVPKGFAKWAHLYLVVGSVAIIVAVNPLAQWKPREGTTPPVPPVVTTPPVPAGTPPFVPAGPERMAHVPANVMELITKSRRELAGKSLDESKCKGEGEGMLACRGDYIISATDIKGEIKYVTVYQGEKPSVDGYSVKLGDGNGKRATGVNPEIEVAHPPGTTVLAIKTAIDWAGTPTWAVYVPYTPEINTPEVRAAGVAYLWSQIERAQSALRSAGVRSQFFKELVVDVVPADHVFTLVLTENVTHPDPFLPSGSNARRLELLNEALAQLGANQTKAWDYRTSSVGARGKGQFMPKTYDNLCTTYNIVCPLHAQGTQDDNLLLKLMFLHADDEWRGMTVTKKQREAGLEDLRSWLRAKPMLMRQYLALGYNGFYGNAARALRACGEERWRSVDCTYQKGKKTKTYFPDQDQSLKYAYKYDFIHGQHWEAAVRDAVAAEVYPEPAPGLDPATAEDDVTEPE